MFLGTLYYQVNPDMERYVTHLIPFLLFPASFAFVKIIEFAKRQKNKLRKDSLLIVIVILISLQSLLTFRGIKYDTDSSWYHTSYEEKTAVQIKNSIPPDAIIITSLPEPYFYQLKNSTHSIADIPPYVFIADSQNSRTVIIIEDMGMHDLFPKFTKFLHTNLQQYKIKQLWIKEKYHTRDVIIDEKYPVVLYKISLAELKKIIKKTAVKENK